jgi:hypothetical protein
MTRGGRVLAVAVGMVTCLPLLARAQRQTDAGPGRVELGIGWTRIGRAAVGGGDATETTSSGATLSLFSTSTERAAASGVEGRVGVALTRRFECEGTGTYAAPQWRTRITGDYENAASVTAAETVHRFTVGGAILWYVRHPRIGPPLLTPFLTAGGGYWRELHAGAVLADTGRFYDVGGGLKVLLRSREEALVKGVGVRIDARVQARTGGIAFDGASRLSPTLGVSLFGRF